MKLIKLNSGAKYNMLTVIRFVGSKNKQKVWLCKCDCGNEIEIETTKIINNLKKSCGCLQKNVLITRNSKHNLSKHRLYIVFKAIKARCLNKNNKRYPLYGGRGIKLYDEWVNNPSKFINYILDNLGERPDKTYSLDRINNDGHYEPNNLRWATQSTQVKNSRRCKNDEHPTEESV